MESPTPKIRLTQRRILLSKAHVVAEQHVIEALTPIFKQQFRKLEKFLRKGNLRKRLSKLEKHRGPGNHPSGSGQDVHGSSGGDRPHWEKGIVKRDTFDALQQAHPGIDSIPYFISPQGDIIDAQGYEHDSYLYSMLEGNPQAFEEEFGSLRGGKEPSDQIIEDKGYMRVRKYGSHLIIQSQKVEKETLKRIQQLNDQGKFPQDISVVEWEGVDYNNVRGLGPETIGGAAPGKIYVNQKASIFFSSNKIVWDEVEYTHITKLNKGEVSGLPLPTSKQIPLLFQAAGSPTENEEEWNAWKKALLIALLLGLFQATDDLAEVENLFWLSRGQDELTYDAETLILAYQLRTGRPLESIALATFVAIERLIREWYVSDDTFPQLLVQLNRYFNDVRIKTIARHEVGNLLSQMVAQQMVSYGLKNWYWDAMGENPCKNDIHIKGITYEGCSDLNGRHFILGDPMPPDAAHVGCQCLPTIREDLRKPIDRKSTVGDQHPKAPRAGPLKQPRTRRFLNKGEAPGHPFRGNQWTGKYPTKIETVRYPIYPHELKVDRNLVEGDPQDPSSTFKDGYDDLYSIVPQRKWDDRSEPEIIWRSLSAYEFEAIQQSGEIQSTNAMSFHDQKGMTFYGADPSRMYAEDNFKEKVIQNHIIQVHPDFPKPRLGDVAYIVGIKTPKNIQRNRQGEYYTTSPEPSSSILRVIEARPGTYDPRERSFGFFGYKDVTSQFDFGG